MAPRSVSRPSFAARHADVLRRLPWLVLNQEKVAGKSNEITAIPELLEVLHIKGLLVSIDAMGCEREIAAKIVEKGGDYLLAVKGNQPALHQQVRDLISDAQLANDGFKHEDKSHGRAVMQRRWQGDRPRAVAWRQDRWLCRLATHGRRQGGRTRGALLHQLAQTHPRRIGQDRACALGHREQASLDARRLPRRGRLHDPQGQRTAEPLAAQEDRAEPDPRGQDRHCQDEPATQAQAGGLG